MPLHAESILAFCESVFELSFPTFSVIIESPSFPVGTLRQPLSASFSGSLSRDACLTTHRLLWILLCPFL